MFFFFSGLEPETETENYIELQNNNLLKISTNILYFCAQKNSFMKNNECTIHKIT